MAWLGMLLYQCYPGTITKCGSRKVSVATQACQGPGSKTRPPQLPRLPDDDYKIIIRARGGLNLSSMSTGKLQDFVFNTP
ncbi:hypothetical protein HPB47_019522 [Ixodes persulcatus]|uniref:Uncharacterized protein n=1 Tax=Ixodes persulcatus TaxID=34615 RepID=A0AC60QHY8_IXOPE|nr:hypothetical protein HPB47_019522 [Ixodes persulcatus]